MRPDAGLEQPPLYAQRLAEMLAEEFSDVIQADESPEALCQAFAVCFQVDHNLLSRACWVGRSARMPPGRTVCEENMQGWGQRLQVQPPATGTERSISG